METRDRFFELFKICLADRKRPGAINGELMSVEELALSDATRALTVFENRLHDLDFDLQQIREEPSLW